MRRATAALVVLAASCGGDETGPRAGGGADGMGAADPAAVATTGAPAPPATPGSPRPATPRAARPAEPEPFSLATSEPEPLPGTAKELADALDADPEGRRTLEILRALEGLDADALPELIRLTRVPGFEGWACNRIGHLGIATPEAVDAIVVCIRLHGEAVRAEWPLSRLGDAGLAAAAKLADDPDAAIRLAGLRAITSAGRVLPDMAPILVRAAASPDRDVQKEAAHALRLVPAMDETVIATLLALARSPEERVQVAALESIRDRADAFARHAADVVRIGESGGPSTDWVTFALAAIGPDATLLALASQDPVLRCCMAQRADAHDARVRDALVALLRDDVADVREAAVGSLAEIDDPPREAAAAAVEMLRSAADVTSRAAAARVTGRLLAKGAVPLDPLLAALADRDPAVRAAAALALAENCAPADRERVLAAIRPLWERDDVAGIHAGVRVPIAGAAGALEGEGTATVAFLARTAVGWGDESVFAALARIGTHDAVTELLSWLDSKRWEQRGHAVRALGDVRTPDDRIVPALLKELQGGRNAEARAIAARALARHASDAQVRAALESVVRSSSRELADAALEALGAADAPPR